MQSGVQEWKARIAIRSSQGTEPTETNLSAATSSLAPYLCYVCHTTLTSKGARVPPPFYPDGIDLTRGLSPLPTWTTSSVSFKYATGNPAVDVDADPDDGEFTVTRKMPRSEMRDAVKEFLLDE